VLIGIILLIGIVKKNGSILVDFAIEQYLSGGAVNHGPERWEVLPRPGDLEPRCAWRCRKSVRT
jgi:hypothetical protein